MGGSIPGAIGRYALYDEIASGGMASVHIGRLLATGGFARTVAIKRMQPQLTKDEDFVAMFLDEARLAARVRHANVVQTLDVVTLDREIFLVLEYIAGESLARLIRTVEAARAHVPVRIATGIVAGVLHGLHAAHEATDEAGKKLDIVHRDVSPHNVLVGTDGIARVLDFGVAKAMNRLRTTRDGTIRGKLSYMSPEHVRGETTTRAADIYAAGIVLWETLTGARLFDADNEAAIVSRVVAGAEEPPSRKRPDVAPELDAVVMKALAKDPSARFATAREMAFALDRAAPVAAAHDIGEWVEQNAGSALAARAAIVARVERDSSREPIPAAGGAAIVMRPSVRSRVEPLAPTRVANPAPPPPAAGQDAIATEASVAAVARGGSGSSSRGSRTRSAAILFGAVAVLAAASGVARWTMARRAASSASVARPTDAPPASSSAPPIAAEPSAAPAAPAVDPALASASAAVSSAKPMRRPAPRKPPTVDGVIDTRK